MIREEKNGEGVTTHSLLWKENEKKSRKNGSLSSIYWVTTNNSVKKTGTLQLSTEKKPEYKTGVRYAGNWKDNQKHGFGTQEWTCGTKYEGDWKFGKRCGPGTLWTVEKKNKGLRKEYTGEWKDNKRHGIGINYYSDYKYRCGSCEAGIRRTIVGDAVYEGEWLNNKHHGQGKLAYPNGDTYEGEWAVGLPHGVGRLSYANGDCYEGGWSRGKKEGSGRYHYWATGKVYQGEWTKDTPKSGEYLHDESYFARGEQNTQPSIPREKTPFELPALEVEDPDVVLQSALNEARRTRAQRYGERELLVSQLEHKTEGKVSMDQEGIFTSQEIEYIQDVFARIDRRKVGRIEASKVQEALNELDLEPSEEQLGSLLAELGVEHSTLITLEEFIGLLTTLKC